MVAAKRSDTIEACVKKMIAADVRHLPVIDDHTGEVFGLISVKVSKTMFSIMVWHFSTIDSILVLVLQLTTAVYV